MKLGLKTLLGFTIFDKFFGDDFLVDRTTNFHFNVSGCSVSFSPANECTDIYFEYRRSLCQRVALFCIFDCSQS